MTGFGDDVGSGTLAGEEGPGVSGKGRGTPEEYAGVVADARLGDLSVCCGSRQLELGM